MKKVKIMLSAIAVLAAVGGALAFKAKTFAGEYCIRPITKLSGACTVGVLGRNVAFASPGTYYFYTVTNDALSCSQNTIPCRTTTTIKLTVE